jgi:isopenicillin-N N-acyltransferase-like protein
MAQLPILDLGDDPFERGTIHGQRMAPHIRANLETYLRRFEAGGVSRERAMREGEEWVAFMRKDNPEYAEEMRGIAEGAETPLRDIAMLNARYEITYSVFSREAQGVSGATVRASGGPDGCSSFGALPEITRSGHTLLGQNWDWLAGLKGHTLLVRVRRTDKPSFVGFTEAGIVGCKMGVNEDGIGLVVNGLVTRQDGSNAYMKPFHVRCREVLDVRAFDKALLPIVQTNRVCSTNFLVGHAEGELIDIEASPNDANCLYPVDGLIAHANHFEHPRSIASEMERISPSTLFRGARLERLLRRNQGRLTLSDCQAALSDHFSHPVAICRHEDPNLPEAKRTISVTSVLLDLNERTIYATDGQPCENEYQACSLDPAHKAHERLAPRTHSLPA